MITSPKLIANNYLRSWFTLDILRCVGLRRMMPFCYSFFTMWLEKLVRFITWLCEGHRSLHPHLSHSLPS